MTPAEKAAFVDSYARNVAHLPKDYVIEFLDKYLTDDRLEYMHDEIGIVDALCVWRDAIKWQIKEGVTA